MSVDITAGDSHLTAVTGLVLVRIGKLRQQQLGKTDPTGDIIGTVMDVMD